MALLIIPVISQVNDILKYAGLFGFDYILVMISYSKQLNTPGDTSVHLNNKYETWHQSNNLTSIQTCQITQIWYVAITPVGRECTRSSAFKDIIRW